MAPSPPFLLLGLASVFLLLNPPETADAAPAYAKFCETSAPDKTFCVNFMKSNAKTSEAEDTKSLLGATLDAATRKLVSIYESISEARRVRPTSAVNPALDKYCSGIYKGTTKDDFFGGSDESGGDLGTNGDENVMYAQECYDMVEEEAEDADRKLLEKLKTGIQVWDLVDALSFEGGV